MTCLIHICVHAAFKFLRISQNSSQFQLLSQNIQQIMFIWHYCNKSAYLVFQTWFQIFKKFEFKNLAFWQIVDTCSFVKVFKNFRQLGKCLYAHILQAYQVNIICWNFSCNNWWCPFCRTVCFLMLSKYHHSMNQLFVFMLLVFATEWN